MIPKNKRAFPNLIDAYLSYAEDHEGTKRIHKWAFISVIAGALERKVWIDRGYYTLYPNLYVFIIGRSGLIKKSTSTGIAVNFLRELKNIKIMSERLTASSLIEQLTTSHKRFEVCGKVFQQSAVFSYASELSVFITEVFGSITELLTTFYDCVPHDSSKPWIYKNIGRGELKIYGPCLNLLGASTKAWLKKCIPKSEIEGGFTSRIIFVVENNMSDKLIAWPEIDKKKLKLKESIQSDLQQIYELTGPVTVDSEARKFFTGWYENHMRNIVPLNSDPRMSGYMSRKGDTILKLGVIKMAASRNRLHLLKEDLVWAAQEIEELEGDWRLAFDGIGYDETQLNYSLYQYIKNKPNCSIDTVLKYFHQQFPAQAIGEALQDLVDQGQINTYKKIVDGKETIMFGNNQTFF